MLPDSHASMCLWVCVCVGGGVVVRQGVLKQEQRQ
jgi:hypothetical protein